MSKIIELTKEHFDSKKTGTFCFAKVYSVKGDVKVYGHYLKNILEEYVSHLEENYFRTDLLREDVIVFEKSMGDISTYIDTVLAYVDPEMDKKYSVEDGFPSSVEIVEDNLKTLKSTKFTEVIEWFKMLDIPFRHAQIIDIQNFIGVK